MDSSRDITKIDLANRKLWTLEDLENQSTEDLENYLHGSGLLNKIREKFPKSKDKLKEDYRRALINTTFRNFKKRKYFSPYLKHIASDELFLKLSSYTDDKLMKEFKEKYSELLSFGFPLCSRIFTIFMCMFLELNENFSTLIDYTKKDSPLLCKLLFWIAYSLSESCSEELIDNISPNSFFTNTVSKRVDYYKGINLSGVYSQDCIHYFFEKDINRKEIKKKGKEFIQNYIKFSFISPILESGNYDNLVLLEEYILEYNLNPAIIMNNILYCTNPEVFLYLVEKYLHLYDSEEDKKTIMNFWVIEMAEYESVNFVLARSSNNELLFKVIDKYGDKYQLVTKVLLKKIKDTYDDLGDNIDLTKFKTFNRPKPEKIVLDEN